LLLDDLAAGYSLKRLGGVRDASLFLAGEIISMKLLLLLWPIFF